MGAVWHHDPHPKQMAWAARTGISSAACRQWPPLLAVGRNRGVGACSRSRSTEGCVMANPSKLIQQNEHVVAQFPTDGAEELCIRFFESDGEYHLDVRVFCTDDVSGGWF